MERAVSISEHAEFLQRLGSSLPPSLDRYGIAETSRADAAGAPIAARFTYRDVPFVAHVEHRDGVAMLCLTGAVGPLPFSAQAARRRRRALTTLAAAGGVPLTWRVSMQQEITVEGAIALGAKPGPAAVVGGAVRLLLQGDHYLSLLLDVLGDSANLDAPAVNVTQAA